MAPIDKRILNDPGHWQDRAEEVRSLAEQMGDAETRRMMLEIATGYEKLAKRAADRGGPIAVAKFEVVVVDSDIIVNIPGTGCSITYQRSSGAVTEKREWTRIDRDCPFTLEQFREATCRQAIAKARELGWLV